MFGDPSSQACASEMHTLWNSLQTKLDKRDMEHLAMVRPAVAHHQLVLRIRGAPARTDAAIDMARSLRDAMDGALQGLTVRDKPLRAGLEISPDRKERLGKFSRAQDSLAQHWRDIGIDASTTRVWRRFVSMDPRCMSWATWTGLASVGSATLRAAAGGRRRPLHWRPQRPLEVLMPRDRRGVEIHVWGADRRGGQQRLRGVRVLRSC